MLLREIAKWVPGIWEPVTLTQTEKKPLQIEDQLRDHGRWAWGASEKGPHSPDGRSGVPLSHRPHMGL